MDGAARPSGLGSGACGAARSWDRRRSAFLAVNLIIGPDAARAPIVGKPSIVAEPREPRILTHARAWGRKQPLHADSFDRKLHRSLRAGALGSNDRSARQQSPFGNGESAVYIPQPRQNHCALAEDLAGGLRGIETGFSNSLG